MKRTFAVRPPSAAMAVAVTALFVALGGTGYAAAGLSNSHGGTAARKKHKATKPPANDNAGDTTLVRKLAPRLLVAFAKNASSATDAGHASNADSATNAGHASNADNATNAGHASSADSATNANHATTADTASAATSSATLGSGQTEVGFVYIVAPENDGGSSLGQQISFPHSLASAPQGHVVPNGGPSTAQCPGSYTNPTAAPGYLCVYIAVSTNGNPAIDQLTRFGAGVAMIGRSGGNPPVGEDYFYGTWAATG